MNQGPYSSFYLVPPERSIIQEWDVYFKRMDVKAVSWEVAIEHDTRSYIEQMICSFHVPFRYADVKAQHEQDVMNGATPRMGKLYER